MEAASPTRTQSKRQDKIKEENAGLPRIRMSPSRALRMYKEIWVLNCHINSCTSYIYWTTFKVLNVTSHALGLFVTIKLHDAIPLPGFAVFPLLAIMWVIMAFFIYPLLGKIYERSEEFTQRWKERLENTGNPLERAEGKRQIRALQFFGIRISSVYTVKKTTILVVLGIVVNLTVNLLLLM